MHKRREQIFINYYQRLKDIREDNQLEQKDLAKILKTTQQQISRYETGIQNMNIERYIIYAKYFNVSLDYLAGLVDTPKTLDGNPYSFSSINNVGSGNININNTGNGNKINIKK